MMQNGRITAVPHFALKPQIQLWLTTGKHNGLKLPYDSYTKSKAAGSIDLARRSSTKLVARPAAHQPAKPDCRQPAQWVFRSRSTLLRTQLLRPPLEELNSLSRTRASAI